PSASEDGMSLTDVKNSRRSGMSDRERHSPTSAFAPNAPQDAEAEDREKNQAQQHHITARLTAQLLDHACYQRLAALRLMSGRGDHPERCGTRRRNEEGKTQRAYLLLRTALVRMQCDEDGFRGNSEERDGDEEDEHRADYGEDELVHLPRSFLRFRMRASSFTSSSTSESAT